MKTPRIGLILGDPCGVGPEVCAKLVDRNAARDDARIVVIADPELFDKGCGIAGVANPVRAAASPDAPGSEPILLRADLPAGASYRLGEATAEGGAYALASFKAGLAMANTGAIDALCYAPFNKEALALAGSHFADEFAWLVEEIGYRGPYCDCTVLDGLWTARVTSHVPIEEVARHVTVERVVEVAHLVHDAIRRSGVEQPRLAVAALNPHAGDGGLIGRTEIDVLAPAVRHLDERLGCVEGPFASDTVFLRGRDGDFDGVVCMYHDQGQIALKLMGFGRAISVVAGPGLPVATPAQGTAFDIAGRGVAKPDGMLNAFDVAHRMALAR